MMRAERASALHTLQLSRDALRFPVKVLEGMMSLWNEVTWGWWTWAQMGAPPVLWQGLNPTFVRATHHDRRPMVSAPSDGSHVRQLHCPSLAQWELVIQRIKAQKDI